MKRLIWLLYPVAGVLIGLIAWGNNPATMPVSLLIFPAWYYAPNRFIAWSTVFCYFLTSGHDLPIASINYFQIDIFRAFFDLAVAVLISSIPFFLLFFKNKKYRIFGLLVITVLITLPPIGLTCCHHPLASTGIWFPGSGWLGFVTTFAFIPAFCRWPFLLIVPIAFGLTGNHNPGPVSPSWQSVNTYFPGKPPGQRNDFGPLRLHDFLGDFVQQSTTITLVNKTSKKTKFLLLPESSGGNWFAGNVRLWQDRLVWPGTVLISATVPAGEYKDSVIIAVSRTETKQIYKQRQPVPVSMWWPCRKYSYLAHWFDNPTVEVGKTRVAFFVCYEQFLVWPVLHSMIHKPNLLCATSNAWWSTGTNIPAIQHNIMLSWSRLFNLPLLTAQNLEGK